MKTIVLYSFVIVLFLSFVFTSCSNVEKDKLNNGDKNNSDNRLNQKTYSNENTIDYKDYPGDSI